LDLGKGEKEGAFFQKSVYLRKRRKGESIGNYRTTGLTAWPYRALGGGDSQGGGSRKIGASREKEDCRRNSFVRETRRGREGFRKRSVYGTSYQKGKRKDIS